MAFYDKKVKAEPLLCNIDLFLQFLYWLIHLFSGMLYVAKISKPLHCSAAYLLKSCDFSSWKAFNSWMDSGFTSSLLDMNTEVQKLLLGYYRRRIYTCWRLCALKVPPNKKLKTSSVLKSSFLAKRKYF